VSTEPPTIDFVRYSGRRGAIWLKDAAAMLSAARIPWLMLLLFYYMIQLLVSVIPLAGPLAMMVLRPVFTVGFLAAAWSQERGRMPEIRHLFRGFGANLWALLPVGIVLILGTALAVLSTALVDGGVLLDAITSSAKPDEALVANSRVEGAMLMAILVALPTLLAIWFAPAFDRVSGLRSGAGDGDEPARGARELAARGGLRPAALLLRRRASGNGDRDHLAAGAACRGAVRDRAHRRALRVPVRSGAGDLRLHRLPRHLSRGRGQRSGGVRRLRGLAGWRMPVEAGNR
jgi:hypothetical protein